MFNYYIDENGVIHIYAGSRAVADISDCGGMNEAEVNNLIAEVLYDLGYSK